MSTASLPAVCASVANHKLGGGLSEQVSSLGYQMLVAGGRALYKGGAVQGGELYRGEGPCKVRSSAS